MWWFLGKTKHLVNNQQMNDLDFRLVEEVKEKCNGVSLQNEDVYMNAGFEDFTSCVIRRFRGIEDKEPFTFDAVSTVPW